MEFRVPYERMSSADERKGLILPSSMSENLAEFLGALCGDGHMSQYTNSQGYPGYRIEVCGHSVHDKDYLCNHMYNLIRELFGLEAKFSYHKNQNTMVAYLSSPGLFFFLESVGINIGPKNDISIPAPVLKESRFITHFIRGFFDTDGCVALKKRHRDSGYYPTISLSQKSKGITKHVSSLLKDMGFNVVAYYDIPVDLGTGRQYHINKLEINGRDSLEKWMGFIGFSNPKHLSKVSICLNTYKNGIVKSYCKRCYGASRNRTHKPLDV